MEALALWLSGPIRRAMLVSGKVLHLHTHHSQTWDLGAESQCRYVFPPGPWKGGITSAVPVAPMMLPFCPFWARCSFLTVSSLTWHLLPEGPNSLSQGLLLPLWLRAPPPPPPPTPLSQHQSKFLNREIETTSLLFLDPPVASH